METLKIQLYEYYKCYTESYTSRTKTVPLTRFDQMWIKWYRNTLDFEKTK